MVPPSQRPDANSSPDDLNSKPDPYLAGLATEVVDRTLRSMPPDLRRLASAVPVIYQSYADEDLIEQGFEPDILGLFMGEPVGRESSVDNPVPACIILYVESIWDYCDGDLPAYRKELRLTFLHELGHYLGWNEEQVAAHGLE